MRIDPIERIALTLHHGQRGAYALLLGSGVSSAAGIHTGWGITLDLVTRLAATQGEEPLPDPASWYAANYGGEPDYDELLDQLTSTPAERMALLRGYFEPSEEEAEEGLKRPTQAHRAIARLVRLGYIRMILTTNFDRLTEIALRDEGMEPDVIASEDALVGAMPYTHSRCTVMKLHGDFLDTRIRNTPEELADYPEAWNRQLDRILDDFGLIICGWSGVWDSALRDAMFRSPNCRFATYWLVHGGLDERARDLAEHRKAEVVPIESADGFFASLLEKLEALEEMEPSHPTSVAMTVAAVKRYLPDPLHRIRLHDLIQEETERTYGELSSGKFNVESPFTTELFHERLHQYESAVERLAMMGAAISYHDEGGNSHHLTRIMERLVSFDLGNEATDWLELQLYPALLFAYVTGIAALAGGHLQHLSPLLRAPNRYHPPYQGGRTPAIEQIYPMAVFSHTSKIVPFPEAERKHTPVSLYLFKLLGEWVRSYLPDKRDYADTFDRFEFLLGLAYMDRLDEECLPLDEEWLPLGRFWWSYFGYHSRDNWENSTLNLFLREEVAKGQESDLLRSGFFNGSAERFKEKVDQAVELLLAHPPSDF